MPLLFSLLQREAQAAAVSKLEVERQHSRALQQELVELKQALSEKDEQLVGPIGHSHVSSSFSGLCPAPFVQKHCIGNASRLPTN